MKIYTKTGDAGETGLFGGSRVGKDNPRIEAYGDVDELNSVLGVVRSEDVPSDVDQLLEQIQNDLFAIGAELASPEPTRHGADSVADSHVRDLETSIDKYEEHLPPLKQFILPGGAKAAAGLHYARTVCRRVERRIVALSNCPDEQVSDVLLRYVNRLSDLLFVLARAVNAAAGHADVPWRKG